MFPLVVRPGRERWAATEGARLFEPENALVLRTDSGTVVGLSPLTTIISHRLSGFDLFATPEYEGRFVGRLEESMATGSLVDAQNLQKYELALERLGASTPSKKQRPIVERATRTLSHEEAVSAAANALAALCNQRQTRSNRGER